MATIRFALTLVAVLLVSPHREAAWLWAADDAYARPQLLVEPDQWDALQKSAARLVTLDARPRAEYDAGHVPGAQWVDHAAWAKAFGQGTDAAWWSERIGNLGIDARTTVVVYDATRGKDAARIWWILRYWGVADARLLNGGWRGWTADNRPLQKEQWNREPVEFTATPQAQRLATKARLLELVQRGDAQIVDARSEREHCGLDKLSNRRAGAIPGAKHLDWSDLVDERSHRLLPAPELRRLLKEAGIDPARPVATHCQSGGRSSVMAFALELMGGNDVANYYASWAEWGNADDTPIEPGKPRGKSP